MSGNDIVLASEGSSDGVSKILKAVYRKDLQQDFVLLDGDSQNVLAALDQSTFQANSTSNLINIISNGDVNLNHLILNYPDYAQEVVIGLKVFPSVQGGASRTYEFGVKVIDVDTPIYSTNVTLDGSATLVQTQINVFEDILTNNIDVYNRELYVYVANNSGGGSTLTLEQGTKVTLTYKFAEIIDSV